MSQTNDEIINELLSEFKKHRDAIMDMIKDLEVFKEKVDNLIPQKLDQRYMRYFEDKIKSATELFKTLLEMRKEIQKSLKDEIDLRRKVKTGGDIEEEIEEILDIRKLANKVEAFRKKKDEMVEQSVVEAQEATDEIAAEVSEMNTLATGGNK